MNDPTRRGGRGRYDEEDSGAPRWVWILGIVVAVVALLFVVMMLVGGGEHGPSRHTPGGADTPTASLPRSGGPGGHTQPPGGHTPPPGGHG